jgi:hypothetical protein
MLLFKAIPLFSNFLRVPIAPSNGYSSEKARLGAKKPAQHWIWTAFSNPGRNVLSSFV